MIGPYILFKTNRNPVPKLCHKNADYAYHGMDIYNTPLLFAIACQVYSYRMLIQDASDGKLPNNDLAACPLLTDLSGEAGQSVNSDMGPARHVYADKAEWRGARTTLEHGIINRALTACICKALSVSSTHFISILAQHYKD